MVRILLSLLALMMLSLGGREALSEDPPPKPTQSKSDLTEGLMDLLREPAKEKSSTSPDKQSSTPAAPSPKATIDGEDIGHAPRGPLADIESEMSTLANWMRSKSDATRTKELQRNVLSRLDEMIAQLEQQSASPSSKSQASQSEDSRSQQSQAQNSSTQPSFASRDNQTAGGQQPSPSSDLANNNESANANSNGSSSAQGQDKDRAGQSSGGNDPQAAPGQPGLSPTRQRTVNVDLNDPRALQRSAWGNLPERMREQMQSRMVERFLPPYREEIEAYYRALVK